MTSSIRQFRRRRRLSTKSAPRSSRRSRIGRVCARRQWDIRDHVTKNLDYYVKQFAQNASDHGVNVHFASTGNQALWEALDIFENHGAFKAVKSKSMMTEEIGLNHVLEEAGVEVIETLRREHPADGLRHALAHRRACAPPHAR